MLIEQEIHLAVVLYMMTAGRGREGVEEVVVVVGISILYMLRFSVVVNKLSLLSWILATCSACQRATGQTDEISWI